MRFYQSVIGDSPYPSFTLTLVENLLPGGHSPPYFALLNQPLPNSPVAAPFSCSAKRAFRLLRGAVAR